VALTAQAEHIAHGPGGPAASQAERAKRRRHRLPNYRLVRYADDWCLMVAGTRDDAEALREEIAGILAPMGLRLLPGKNLITHIDEGLDFPGWRIQRHRKRGSDQHYVYTYRSGKAVKAITGKVRTTCRAMDTSQPPDALLRQLNPALRGWCTYFRPGVSSRTFAYLSY
jgi:RNA-directed DNA polymerase